MEDEYQAYLLRFQRSSKQPNWRVQLENALDGEVKQFATEWEALRYLLKELDINLQMQSSAHERKLAPDS